MLLNRFVTTAVAAALIACPAAALAQRRCRAPRAGCAATARSQPAQHPEVRRRREHL